MNPRSITPEQAEEIRQFIASGKTARQIGEIIGRTKANVIQLVVRKQLGPWLSRPGHSPGDISHIPEDFEEKWQTMSQAKLAAHYHRTSSTIGTWAKRKGLVRTVPTVPRAPAKAVKPVKRPSVLGRVGGHKQAAFSQANRDMSYVGRAVDHLRFYGPVYGCDAAGKPQARMLENGKPNPKSTHWNRGGRILDDDEIIERAEWKGFDAHAWKKVA